MSARSDRDMELYTAYKANPNKNTLNPLLKQFDGTINKAVNKWGGGNVAPMVLKIKAKGIVKDAINNFDPSKSQLNTHVTNHLKGLSRPVYETQVARMPESRTYKTGTFLARQDELTNTLGRIPTVSELSEDLKWSQKEVGRFREELRAQYSTSKPTPPGFENFNSDMAELDFIYHDLNDQDKVVFEHTTGYGGAPILSGAGLTRKSKLTQGQISHSKRRIRNKVLTYRGMK
jgi:hypothetical protein